MTAIFGALSTRGEVLSPELGQRMAKLLERPVDAEGQAHDGRFLLGARTRWLTDQELGDVPPWVDRETGVVAVFDGRLDHHESLALSLGVLPSLPDVALMAAAYRHWGQTFVRHLRGDFALAVWDPEKDRLLLSRDPFGVRPLYFCMSESGTLLFASRARALFAHQGCSQALDALRIAHYLTSHFEDAEGTFFRGVKRLAPGHSLVAYADGRIQQRRYFAFEPEHALPVRSNAEYAEQFRSLFMDAVRVRTRTRGNLACLLSGGLDSSGLLGALNRLLPGQAIPCFSARFVDFPEVDEGAWLSLHDTAHATRAELRADRLGPLDSIDEVHAHLDEPFHAPNLFIYGALARCAHEHGTHVLLDGMDGDTVVDHGYQGLRELFFLGAPRRFVAALRALRRRMGFSYGAMLKEFVFAPELRALHALLVRFGLMRTGYVRPAFARQSGLVRDLERRIDGMLGAPATLRGLHHRAVTAPVLPFYLEVYDKLSAALGVEHRHPYFDTSLITFCLGLPAEQRLWDGWDRVVQRRAFVDLVPEPIRARQTKSVWTRNFERQLFGCHRERIRGLLESTQSPLSGYCDLGRMRRDLPELEAGRAPQRMMDFWCAVSLGTWLEFQQQENGLNVAV